MGISGSARLLCREEPMDRVRMLPSRGRQPELWLGRQPELWLGRQPELWLGRQPELWLGRQPELWLGSIWSAGGGAALNGVFTSSASEEGKLDIWA